MERDLLSAIAHRDHPIAAPVSEANLDRLLRRAALPEAARVLDVGCGEGEWSLRALELVSSAVADGVDISPHALASAGRAAAARGLSDRISLHSSPAERFSAPEPYDLVLCMGSTHAFGGLKPTMDAIARFVRPGGLALVGEGFWERPPTPELAEVIGDYRDLAGTVETAESEGWLTVYAHVSTLEEWDEYEWSWTGSLSRWAAEHPGPDGDQALAAAREHRELWLNGYRATLGFASLLLLRV
ncbi:SAM-dependent methyltransferase [Sphaerisporangium krabiense]|uniref:SAM-dependent methyltransferase n=1 Tax=Sphaerisporangium krabiense TaxID=763782 RepID=A0A7W8Z798_9ACTN|nr:class I SAM-dependent methyltransferase [Sphaerisporangium krabiense]MBB5628812.1 SAM-dependent methyltransferase [Sphaerisporangium krabiense]GII60346.1 SAM-dependent methyltransferase [Sphaerisporangium krabiense]